LANKVWSLNLAQREDSLGDELLVFSGNRSAPNNKTKLVGCIPTHLNDLQRFGVSEARKKRRELQRGKARRSLRMKPNQTCSLSLIISLPVAEPDYLVEVFFIIFRLLIADPFE
jgi:hypothetical protein